MKIMKGIMIGTFISAGVMWMCNKNNNNGTSKFMKKGKKILKEIL